MNITELAEQIVFGRTMEDKLVASESVSFDVLPSSKLTSVAGLKSPGRPPGLRMQTENRNNPRPKDHQLENERARGQLLHFLANHELLATELMALVLLKFPEAPRAFRQGVYATLLEEQQHTQMYIDRMKECGVEFGEYPVSGQFWRMVEPMQSPMQFVSRLSLTFEQANLDYSHHFAKVFRRIGDQATAAVLQTIYEDEISHVRHGLHWFQQWKQPSDSDWQAYQRELEFPLSPVRGRGPGVAFNREGRLQAGLSTEFIDAIQVCGQSKGRATAVRWFDAAAEERLADPESGKSSERNSSLLKQLNRDLESVLLAVAKPDDILVVDKVPSESIRRHWSNAFSELPEFLARDQATQVLQQRKIHDVQPWAWTPFSHEVMAAWVDSVRHPPKPWQANHVELYRKSWSTGVLRDWLAERGSSEHDFSAANETVGQAVYRMKQVTKALAEFKELGFENAIFKRDLATSGRGQRRLACNQDLQASDLQWLESMFGRKSNSVAESTEPIGVVEPELDRVVDLSFLWDWSVHESQPRFLGWSRPLVAKGRRYIGTRLGNAFNDCDPLLRRFLLEDGCRRLKETAEWLGDRLPGLLTSHGHFGSFGVDAMVYQDSERRFHIKPMVELNSRLTMGHIALGLRRRVADRVESEFRVLTADEWKASSSVLLSETVQFDRTNRWSSGCVMFNDFTPSSKLMPVLLVGSSLNAFQRSERGEPAVS